MKYYIACKACGKRVTKLLTSVPLPDFSAFTDEPLLSDGQFCRDEDGHFYISIGDKHKLKAHPDSDRWLGCCGAPPDGSPNLICSCQCEIGREVSDCYTPHFVRFDPAIVDLKTDHNAGLEAILCSDASEEEKASLEILWQYGQT